MRAYIDKYADFIFRGFAGVDNCDYCDSFTHVNEWETPDGAPHFVCGNCQYSLRFPAEKA